MEQEILFEREYYAGFGENRNEIFYRQNGKYYCQVKSTGYWSSKTHVRETSKEEIEQTIVKEYSDMKRRFLEKEATYKKMLEKINSSFKII